MVDSNTPESPTKPYPEFPSFWHPRGGWTKKVRNRLVYFGKVSADEALEAYVDQKDDLNAGRIPRARSDDPTVGEAINTFLAAREDEVEDGDLGKRTFTDYLRLGKYLSQNLGKHRLIRDVGPRDFAEIRPK